MTIDSSDLLKRIPQAHLFGLACPCHGGRCANLFKHGIKICIGHRDAVREEGGHLQCGHLLGKAGRRFGLAVVDQLSKQTDADQLTVQPGLGLFRADRAGGLVDLVGDGALV